MRVLNNARILTGAVAILALAAAGWALWLNNRQVQSEALSRDVTQSILRLERSIGYGGFIHHFKNYVLRPEEPYYAALALQAHRRASDELVRLDGILANADLQADLSALQETLDLYRNAIDLARQAHERGESIGEVDRLVRIVDEDAVVNLATLEKRIEAFLEERGRAILLRLDLSLALTGALLVGLVLTGAYATRQRRRRRQLAAYHQRRELEREHAHAEKLEALISELERSNRELDEFAYRASHDLKEPLRGIAINVNFLAREALSAKGEERIERMVVLTSRMEQLISDLLFFSRLGRGEKVIKDVDAAHIIEGIERELEEWLTERRGEIRIVSNLPTIRAERSQVKTVFQNLIVNGLKYNDAATRTVEIGFDAAVEVNGTTLRDVFWVRDNGIGIEEKNREKIFHIFQRLNREDDYGPGTGAGLSFVRKIVEDYGCSIAVTSEPGQGSSFWFTLPLADTGA